MARIAYAALTGVVLLLVAGAASATKVAMNAAECKLLALKSDWTKITSCSPPPSCTLFNATADDQNEDPRVNILCDKDGYVQLLAMQSFTNYLTGETDNLYGTMPNAWYKLQRVETIIVDSGDLNGTFPAYWGYLKTLKTLIVQNSAGRQSAGLQGPIPTHWGALKNLEKLVVSNLDTPSGKLPNELGLLKKLKQLDLRGNSFSGILPASLSLLPSLQYLYLGSNKFIGDPTWLLGKLASNLVELDMSSNVFSGRLPATLGNATNLMKINFRDCHFTGRLPPEWGNLTALQQLDVQSNKGLVGGFPKTWSKLPTLYTLYIGGTAIRDSIDFFKDYRFIFLYIYPETQLCGNITDGRYISNWNNGPSIYKLQPCK